MKAVRPKVLVIADFDGTLYRSPEPPVPDPSWWYHARSLDGYGPPGFDFKWILDVVIPMRKASQSPGVRTALLTGRTAHSEMKRRVGTMLGLADLTFDYYQFKPVTMRAPNADFKAGVVQRWLLMEPWVEHVILYEDRPENLAAVGRMVQRLGRRYTGVLIPPA
jgi:hypothetical protein